jgi:hypothetical protein
VDLAVLVALRAVGGGPVACGGPGVLVAWLAGQVSAQARTGLRLRVQHPDDRGVPSFGQPVFGAGVPQAEVTVALAALALPTATVAARVQQSWSTLAAPGTTVAQAAQILGVPAPAGSEGGSCR